MKKRILLFSLGAVILLILGGLSSSVVSTNLKNIESTETITVEVNKYFGRKSSPILTDLSLKEADELKEILINLQIAIDENDEQAINHYETILNEKGLFGKSNQKFYSNNEVNEMMKKSGLNNFYKYFDSINGDNISNSMCYFHATGEGLMLFTIGVKIAEAILAIINNQSNFIAQIVLLIALLPFLALTVLFTHLIPFRILMPSGVINMNTGKISSLGLEGYKSLQVNNESVNVNLSWFTGITINIPFSDNPFLFVSGLALDVRPTET